MNRLKELPERDRPYEKAKERGVEALLAMLQGNAPAQKSIVVPHEVIERATTLGE